MNSELLEKLKLTEDDAKMAQDVITAFNVLQNASCYFSQRVKESEYTNNDVEGLSVREFNRLRNNRYLFVTMRNEINGMVCLNYNPISTAKDINYYYNLIRNK